jgi:predicted RecA/RadA family phage recombinase
METFGQPGESLTLTAPSGGVVSGQFYVIGSLVVVASETKNATEAFSCQAKGVFSVTKLQGETWTEGLKIYWDDGDQVFTSVVGTPANTLVGSAAVAVADPADLTRGLVRLDGAAR